jgi:hypothetical protein
MSALAVLISHGKLRRRSSRKISGGNNQIDARGQTIGSGKRLKADTRNSSRVDVPGYM